MIPSTPYPRREAASPPVDVRLLLSRAMPRTFAALTANGYTIAQIAQVLPATAAALFGSIR